MPGAHHGLLLNTCKSFALRYTGSTEQGADGAAALVARGGAPWQQQQQRIDPTRALSRLQQVLLEGDVRELWGAAKARLQARLRDAVDGGSSSVRERRRGGVVGVRSDASVATVAAAPPSLAAPAAAAAAAAAVAAAPAATDAAAAAAAAAAIAADGEQQQQQLQRLYGSDGPFRAAVMYLLAHASRAFMTRANTTVVEGAEHMAAALARPEGRPLITVCNHVAAADDPLVMSTVLPPDAFADAARLRWTLCASDRCFHRALLVPFFRAAKVLPVERGAGMFQPGLAAAEARLREGEWVHIFPEGTRCRADDGGRPGRVGPARKGVGRLVAACADKRPLVVPFVHAGMDKVLPRGAVLPTTRNEVRVLVGEPIEVQDLVARAEAQRWPDDRLYAAIAGRIGRRMARLKARLDGVALLEGDAAASALLGAADAAQRAALEAGFDLYDPADNAHRAATLWERASFRMAHRAFEARARLSAAAAALSARAAASADAVVGGGAPTPAASGGVASPATFAAALTTTTVTTRAAAGAADEEEGGGEGGAAAAAAAAAGWLSPEALCGSAREYYGYQRSVAMMQLLQARV